MEPQVILYFKTRWNILETTNERGLKLLNTTKTVLRLLKRGHFWKKEFYEIVRDMLNCLKPVRLAVETLSNHDANILARNGIFKFLFSNSENQNSFLSRILLKETEMNCLNAGIKSSISH
jgi:hypothetical protein